MGSPLPDLLWITSGAGEGTSEINAFDAALLAGNIGNYNLVKISSVLPKGAVLVEDRPSIEAGSLVPAVYTSSVSQVPGETLSSCIGVGFSEDSHGMIMEHSGPGVAEELEEKVRQMLQEAFAMRGLHLHRQVFASCSHRVDRIGCTVAAAILWWR